MSTKNNRRSFIKNSTLGLAGILTTTTQAAVKPADSEIKKSKKPYLRVAHITDVHIRPEHNAEARFKNCLKQIKKHKVDCFLNGGDTIYAADYGKITRERMLEQWEVWDRCVEEIKDYEIHTCLGNHDMWWAAPTKKEDPMFGKPYVLKRAKMPAKYYHIDKGNWHFIILDSNNRGASFDPKQYNWLEEKLASIPKDQHILIMTHHPIFGVTGHIEGGMNKEYKKMIQLFWKHPNVKVCLSGHNHLFDDVLYNNVNYFCNGAVSGSWWEPDSGRDAKGPTFYRETPPGYAIVDLYEDGTVTNTYYTFE